VSADRESYARLFSWCKWEIIQSIARKILSYLLITKLEIWLTVSHDSISYPVFLISFATQRYNFIVSWSYWPVDRCRVCILSNLRYFINCSSSWYPYDRSSRRLTKTRARLMPIFYDTFYRAKYENWWMPLSLPHSFICLFLPLSV